MQVLWTVLIKIEDLLKLEASGTSPTGCRRLRLMGRLDASLPQAHYDGPNM